VKPWFQGKIPFSFDLPELQGTEFSLLGGRMTYLDQAPGAHLVYQIRKHEISVFIFQEALLPGHLPESASATKRLSFNVATWSQSGLRYFVVGDASASDIDGLARLLRTTGT
jgi:anti-sigma factor RsiW